MNPDNTGTQNRDPRRVRLAASLRENLKRRKAQQRTRAAEAVDAPGPGETRTKGAADDAKR